MSTDLSHRPRTGVAAAGRPHTPPASVTAAVDRSAAAFPEVAAATPARRRSWLEAVADAVEEAADRLVRIADDESALGEPRLRGELGKMTQNARYYAGVGERGEWVRARIQPGAAVGQDLRRAQLPVGPVAVFGASNFPFQFGTLGHDTCSALAAGCPVVVKAHPAHPLLSAALAELAEAALAEAGAPAGTFSVVVGFEAGLILVDDPRISAVAFTGSQRGGLALVERAARRERPIPVFAEMGTVNPVVLTPAARSRVAELAAGFVDSFTLGTGQFCTKPGLLLAPRGAGVPDAVAAEVATRSGGWMLTEGIARAYREGVEALQDAGAQLLASPTDAIAGFEARAGYAVMPAVLRLTAADLAPGSRLLEECFGPAALVVEYRDLPEALDLLGRLQPSLAGSVLGSGPEDPDVAPVVARLGGQAGRVIVDGWPTGVACADAMQHGGPWPATSRPDATSVGAEALGRFTRPVAFQGAPDRALPPALQDANPWRLPDRSPERAGATA